MKYLQFPSLQRYDITISRRERSMVRSIQLQQFRVNAKSGFTIVELLVVVAIIGILVALLLPAVQMAREAGRRTQCQNNLRQIGVAVHNFESTHGHYPSNGWGYLWLGDPDRGVGPKQPGGWIYQLLPFIEATSNAQIGKGLDRAAKRIALADLSTAPIQMLRCPTRPALAVSVRKPELDFYNADVPETVAKTDYAINEGDYVTDTDGGPPTLQSGDNPNFAWTDVSKATGVSFLRSKIRLRDIVDGTSNTYLVGEKYVSIDGYTKGTDFGNDQPLYSGVDVDLNRWTTGPPLPDGLSVQIRRFGSAHPGGTYFVYCDGSVRLVSFLVDVHLHQSTGNRHDGQSRVQQ